MKPNRRTFIEITSKAAGTVVCGQFLISCTSPNTPTEKPVKTAAPAPLPRAELIPATDFYTFVVKVNEDIPSVFEALRIAGLGMKIQDKSNWLTTQGATFRGALVEEIQGVRGSWLINFGSKQFCADVRNQRVPAGTTIGCFIDDGKHYNQNC